MGIFLYIWASFTARANVYATDIHVNNSLQAGVLVPGSPVTISYVLNDTANAGVCVQICAGSNVVKTFTSTAGTNTGLNTLVWDGKSNSGANVAQGAYTVSITAAASGYDGWTNFTGDGTNFEVWYPSGIAVNKNTNSPYYGRVFVGNAYAYEIWEVGIYKYNADGSPAEEGGFGTGDYSWAGGGFANPSPWKMDIGADDRLYVDDWAGNGVVESFDQVLSSNRADVLRADNYAYPCISLSGPCVCGEATNMQIYMADYTTLYSICNHTSYPGMGIISWKLDSNGVAALNDLGTVDVTLTNNSDLTLAPYAVSVDTFGNIYTIQQVEMTNDSDSRVLCFPPAAEGGPPATLSLWEIGSGDPTLVNSYGVAVNPEATFVAVASRGYGGDPENLQNGGVSIFQASNGSLVTNLTEDAAGNTNQEMVDVAWDNVGNLYALDFSANTWRVYSPPGLNQATTVAVPVIQVLNALNPPRLSLPSANKRQLSFTLTGQCNVTYVIQQSLDLINWSPVATNYSPSSVRSVSVSSPDTQDFYRAVTSP